MAFNIFERWPWTSFQNLNLDWLMKAVKEAVTKADQAASSVGQFDDRITTAETNSSEANTKATEALSTANTANGKAAEALSTANSASVTANAASVVANNASDNADQASTDAARALSEVGSAIGSYKILVNAQNQCSHAGELIDAVDALSALTAGRNIFVERENADNPYSHIGYQFAYYEIDKSTTPATTLVFFDRLISYAGENAVVERMTMMNGSNTASFTTIQPLASTNYVRDYVDSHGGTGGAPYQIPVRVSGGVYSTTATGLEIFNNRGNCFAEVNGLVYYPVGCSLSGPTGDVYLASADPHTSGVHEVEILQFTLSGTSAVATVQHYSNDITALPDTTNASADDFLMLDSNKNPAWVAVPNAATVSFGGA